MKKVPKKLQPFLWSVKTDQLDLQKDRIYIVNQILAYGGMEEFKWLFKNYPLKVVREIFLHHPIKTYRPSTFNFVKEILLEVGNTLLVKEKYVVNTPRIIR